ncbi:MAG TPA: hypothetical protein VN915_02520 [Elusimicrobiota bacterium]|nr:hypothetical protein [Elusimicrobiota bacterium]
MGFRTANSAKAGLHGQMKLARLLEMSEKDFEKNVREVEASPLFARLVSAGALAVEPYSGARFASRRFGGWGLRTSSDGVPELIDGQGDVVALIKRVGQERFEELFLSDAALSDEERARRCDISPGEARRLREFVDRVYIQSELETPGADAAAPSVVYSTVAGVEIVDGRPALAFFNREIWKGRYRVNEGGCERLKAAVPPREFKRLESFLRQLEHLDRRKSTLYRVLEAFLDAQADFFVTGEPGRRRPLTQLSLATDLEISPSVLNRLISNKSIQLPWGLETPLKNLVPSSKMLLRDRLYDLMLELPELSDQALRLEIESRWNAKLSRRSVAQYRKELGLGGCGKRSPRRT